MQLLFRASLAHPPFRTDYQNADQLKAEVKLVTSELNAWLVMFTHFARTLSSADLQINLLSEHVLMAVSSCHRVLTNKRLNPP